MKKRKRKMKQPKPPISEDKTLHRFLTPLVGYCTFGVVVAYVLMSQEQRSTQKRQKGFPGY